LLWLWFIVIMNNKIKKIAIFDGITLENYVKRLDVNEIESLMRYFSMMVVLW